jgi:hypothetical protein
MRSRLGHWLRTRQSHDFLLFLLVILMGGAIAVTTALVLGFTIGSSQLRTAGNFASGVGSLFGLASVSAALLLGYVTHNRESRDAEEIWAAKRRLEDAVALYLQLGSGRGYGDDVLKTVLKHLHEALIDARNKGLGRVLSTRLMQEELEAIQKRILPRIIEEEKQKQGKQKEGNITTAERAKPSAPQSLEEKIQGIREELGGRERNNPEVLLSYLIGKYPDERSKVLELQFELAEFEAIAESSLADLGRAKIELHARGKMRAMTLLGNSWFLRVGYDEIAGLWYHKGYRDLLEAIGKANIKS